MMSHSYIIPFHISCIYKCNVHHKCITFMCTLHLIITKHFICNSVYAQSNVHIIYNSTAKYLKIDYSYFDESIALSMNEENHWIVKALTNSLMKQYKPWCSSFENNNPKITLLLLLILLFFNVCIEGGGGNV